MTQRIFDTDNADDMALLWDILSENVVKIEKPYMRGYLCQKYVLAKSKNGEYELPIDINWHDKTEITRPIQEATEADIGKLCYFWNDDDPSEYGQLLYVSSSPEDREGKYQQGHNDGSWKHCRRLTKQEIEELC